MTTGETVTVDRSILKVKDKARRRAEWRALQSRLRISARRLRESMRTAEYFKVNSLKEEAAPSRTASAPEGWRARQKKRRDITADRRSNGEPVNGLPAFVLIDRSATVQAVVVPMLAAVTWQDEVRRWGQTGGPGGKIRVKRTKYIYRIVALTGGETLGELVDGSQPRWNRRGRRSAAPTCSVYRLSSRSWNEAAQEVNLLRQGIVGGLRSYAERRVAEEAARAPPPVDLTPMERRDATGGVARVGVSSMNPYGLRVTVSEETALRVARARKEARRKR